MRCVPCLLAFVLVLAVASPVAGADERATRFELENGLKVWLRPVAGSADVALCVLYDIGEDHDPEGKSGLGHVLEHCYVTSAAGTLSPRTFDDIQAEYPQRWNAQTGAGYTVIAFVFPSESLAEELEAAAARMGSLKITENDLEREVPRALLELSNMFDRFPALVGRNRAHARIHPRPRGGRKGGVLAEIQRLGSEDLQGHHDRYYKPRNARLVLAGGFDPAAARALVEEHFGKLAPGEAAPPPGAGGERRLGPVEVHEIRNFPPQFPGHACIAYPAPSPVDASFASFVVLVGRLFGAQNANTLSDGVRVEWTPLDAGDTLYVSGPLKAGESPEAAERRIRRLVGEVAARPLSLSDRMLARQLFARLLATAVRAEPLLRGDVYAVAFGLARRDQLGIDGPALGKALLDVGEEAFRSTVDRVLAEDKSAAVVVRAR